MTYYLFAIIAILVIANLYFLLKRSKKSRDVGKDAAAERVATVKRHDSLVRKLDYEQRDAARRVELRNKTLEMYDQVRKQANTDDSAQEQTETMEHD